MSRHLYHLTPWAHRPRPGSPVTPASLEREGFVHLCTGAQLEATAQRWFEGHNELAVLIVEAGDLGEELRWEDLYDRGEAFPHLYKAIPESALLGALRMRRDSEGFFRAPDHLQTAEAPLMEKTDFESQGIIEPSRRFPHPCLPPDCVLTFFPEVLEKLVLSGEHTVKTGLGSEIGARTVLLFQDRDLTVCAPGVGGPVAAATLEELIALGCRRFVLCGGAGSLHPELQMGHLVLVEGAVRDEGTSYHYQPCNQPLHSDAKLLAEASTKLEKASVPFRRGLTWTTDALYRETPQRMERRRAQGCLTVEMEIASLLAVARFRGVALLPLLYCGDDVSSDQWDFRDWTCAHSVREKLFWLAVSFLSQTKGNSNESPNGGFPKRRED